MDEDDQAEAMLELERHIIKLLGHNMGATYNSLDSWALVVRATSNDGSGDRSYGGVFMPPDQDKFTTAGLRWLFEEGFKGREP